MIAEILRDLHEADMKMTYEEFVTEYESLVTALLSDKTPKVPGMIYSRTSEEISSKLADLVEAHSEYEERYDETLDERFESVCNPG